MKIDNKEIGIGQRPFIIAEISGNHNQSLERGFAIIDAAAAAGADAIKLQTYTADTITLAHEGQDFVVSVEGQWKGRSLHSLYQEAHTPWEWHAALFARARQLGLAVFSSPFDETAVDFLETLNCGAYKIASLELIHLPLIQKAAATGKPLIISTGLGSAEEIGEAVRAAQSAGCKDLVLLHCVAAYPAPPEDSNLLTMNDMMERYQLPCGLSDHTMGTAVSVAAVARGACVIEKHITMARADGGPDSSFSLEPNEFSQLCRDARTAWSAVGSVSYGPKTSDKAAIEYRRSIYVVEDVKAGDVFTSTNLRCIRPGHGLPPKHFDKVIGSKAARDISRGTPLTWQLLE